MKLLILITSVIIFLPVDFFPQTNVKVMTYNLLNYAGNDTTVRNPYFRTVIHSIKPDILAAQEITTRAAVNGFLNNVMNSSGNIYSAGTYVEDTDNDVAIFFKTQEFSFLNISTIQTNQKKISQFKIMYNSSGDTLILFSLHLQPGPGTSIEADRGKEIDSLRNVTDKLSPSSYFLILGDFNTTGSNESFYEKLLNQNNSGYVIDPIIMTGSWNSAANSVYHTRSTRIRSFGGGLPGGLNYRSDMIFYSKSVGEQGGITYIPGSYTVYGNDGNHFNDSINKLPNTAVAGNIADALYYASDHLPVFALFEFNNEVPVESLNYSDKVEYQLSQNYPNPFNPSTTIKYDLSEESFVTLKIYNINGQEIETLVYKEQPAGRYQIQWQPKNISSGIYLCKLTFNGSLLIKKMILLK